MPLRRSAPASSLRAGRALPLALGVMLVGVQHWLIWTHTAWRDEAQAYLIVRDAGSPGALLHALRYEGHPALWYLLLAAARWVSPGLKALALTQAAVALGTSVLVWRFAPFSRWMRLGLCASYFLLFEYGVIARSYGLGALLLFAFLAMRRSAWAWLCLALLANTSVHGLLLSGACVLILVGLEARWSWPGAALWALGCTLALITLHPAPDARPVIVMPASWVERVAIWLHHDGSALLPSTPPLVGWEVRPPWPLSGLLGAAAPTLGWLALRRDPRAALIWMSMFAVMGAMSLTLYPAYVRHVGYLFLLAVALAWVDAQGPSASSGPSPWLQGWVGLEALCGVWMAACALVWPFSAADQIGAWARAHGLEHAAWAAYPGVHGVDLAARLPVRSFNIQKGCADTFQRWDYPARQPLPPARLRARLAQAARTGGSGGGWLLTDNPADVQAALHTGPTATFDGGLGRDDLMIFRLPPTGSGPTVAAPPCP